MTTDNQPCANLEWIRLCLIPVFRELKELSQRVTAKKAYQDYLDELREKINQYSILIFSYHLLHLL